MLRLRWRPLDGWRRFFGEVGIIILGVLVALGLGAVATEFGWRRDVASARNALAFEVGENVGQSRERLKISNCIERRLDKLGAIVDAGVASGRLPPVGDLRQPPWRIWNSGVWESIVASETARHFPREEASTMISLDQFVVIIRDANLREADVWTRLFALVGPGRTFTDAEAERIRAAIAEARFLNRRMGLVGVRIDQSVDAYDIRYDAAIAAYYADRPLVEYPICQPIDPAIPLSYGQAPFRDSVERARRRPITRASGRG